jgi:hypothetical protein
MKDATRMGKNRTGSAMAPRQGGRQKENEGKSPEGAGAELSRLRMEMAMEADLIGTMPPPASLKGTLKSAVQMGMGRDPKAFLDHLGGRLAFERTGTRLYDALLAKHAAGDSPVGSADAMTLRTFRDQEQEHFRMLADCIENLGADSTCVTPMADLAGVEAMGLIAAVSDPRTTFGQCLDAILVAELADNDAWHMLIELAEGMGQTGMAERFQAAKTEEDVHLETVRRWVGEMAREEAGIEAETVEAGSAGQG